MSEQVSMQPETPHSESTETKAAKPVESEALLQQELDAARHKAEENWQLLLRSKAELENFRKRTQRDVENAHKYGLEKIAAELLAVRDSMELGLGNAREGVDLESIKEGVSLTLKMLVQLMEKFGISEISPENEKFNPELHQAMTLQESDKLEPNTVISVLQKGYRLNDRLLRPALVTVAKAPDKNAKSP
ncbi:MAG TPA: nucleotide exchange factor GrpE [Gammaproteobacteria bacterium]